MSELLDRLMEAVRLAPVRAHDTSVDLGTHLGRVLLSELSSPSVYSHGRAAVTALFHRLQTACGCSGVGGAPATSPTSPGSPVVGSGAVVASAASPGCVVAVPQGHSHRHHDPTAVKALATVLAAIARVGADARVGDKVRCGGVEWRGVRVLLCVLVLSVECGGLGVMGGL